MFRLKTGYFIAGIVTGLILLLTFLWSLPDGKLHITFCNVGQGDAAYIRFPDGRDMVVDGGPDDKVLQCLGRAMPFWDRHINLVVMTHPQKDHMQGLISVLERFTVDYFVRSNVDNSSEGYQKLLEEIRAKKVAVKYETAGDIIDEGKARLTLLWPSPTQITKAHSGVLGASTDKELNDYCLVFLLTYGSFDALFTGDADSRVEADYDYGLLATNTIEVLKFPHHGSRTAATDQFLDAVHPELAVISVGKNNYGHPSKEALNSLENIHSQILRTDQDGDIEVVSDGKSWNINKKNH